MTYVDGFVAPVRAGVTRDQYRAYAAEVDAIFRDVGALRVVDTWADDVPHGSLTDFHRAVAAEAGETLVFGWIEWPDKATRMAGWGRAMADPRMQTDRSPPFDGKRMIFGGFSAVLDI